VPSPTPLPWSAFLADDPDLARAVTDRFAAHRHHVLATIRADGAPRLWGTEVRIVDGSLFLGAMLGTRRADDLRRDGRCALHAQPEDDGMELGDAKLTGRAREVLAAAVRARFLAEDGAGPATPFELFAVDLETVTLSQVHPDGDRLVLRTWRAGGGTTTVERH